MIIVDEVIYMTKIAILSDSGCQLKSSEGIYIVPLQVTVGETSYRDGIDIDSLKIFTMMKEDEKLLPKTSQPSSGDIIETLNRIKQDGYDEVLGIAIATGLSSTLSGMNTVAQTVEIPITLVDSKGTAGNQRYLVQTAARYVAQGLDINEIKARLDKMVDDSATIIATPNLDHLQRGGRITPAVAMLGGLLKIVPVMKLNMDLGGRIDTLGKARTMKRAKSMMIDDMVKHGANGNDYVITVEHVLCEDLAIELANEIKETFGQDTQIDFDLLPSVVGVHMGIGGIGYQYIRKAKD